MDWHEEEELWEILIKYLTIFALIFSILMIIIKIKWLLLHSFIPLLPIRTLWPSMFLSSLHIIVLSIIIAVYMPLIRIDMSPIGENPAAEIEPYVKDSISRMLKFTDLRPIPDITLIGSRQMIAQIEDDLGINCDKPDILNCDLPEMPAISQTDFDNIRSTCPSLMKYDEFIELLDFRSPAKLLHHLRNSFRSTNRKLMERLEDILRLPENSYYRDLLSNWQQIFEFIGYFHQGIERRMGEVQVTYETVQSTSMRRTTYRVKMLYLPLYVLIVFVAYSIIMNIIYPNSPVSQPFSNIHSLLCFIVIFQVLYFFIYTPIRENNDGCLQSREETNRFEDVHLKTCKGKAIRQLIQNDTVFGYMTRYLENVVEISTETRDIGIDNSSIIIDNYNNLAEKMKNMQTTCPAHKNVFEGYQKYSEKFIEFIKYLETREFVVFGNDAKERIRKGLEKIFWDYSDNEEYHYRFLEYIDRNDFDCEENRRSINKIDSLQCKPYSGFHEYVVQCVLLVGSSFCVFFYMMAVRRTDFRQYSDDSRQIWVYKIDKGFNQLAKEFEEKIKMFTPQSVSFKNFDANESRNRYRNILCMDHSRVILQGYNSYIHASWVKIPRIDLDPLTHTALDGTERQYIVTQAPLEETITEFYAMCWQQKVEQIVMLCEFDENSGQMAHTPYFPFKFGESTVYNNYKVTNMGTWKHPINNVIHTKIQLESLNEIYTEPRTLNHLCIQNWPEKKVPEDPQFLLDLRDWVNEKNGKTNPPIVIHSSAGTGRAGTYVALDYLNSRTHEDEFSSASDLIKELRRMRWGVIESQEQFIYLIVCLVELISRQGIVDHQLGLKYVEEYKNYKNEKESPQQTESTVKEKTEVENTITKL